MLTAVGGGEGDFTGEEAARGFLTFGDVALSRHTEHAPSALALRNVGVLGYTALNLIAFGHKILSFGKFFLLIRKKFVPL